MQYVLISICHSNLQRIKMSPDAYV